jgi:hypothetical protein
MKVMNGRTCTLEKVNKPVISRFAGKTSLSIAM